MLEVGGGLGVLSEYLAERTAHVHVVELDRGLEPALRDALDPHPNTTLHFADAVKLDLDALEPAPNKVVANLPYGVAATVILRTIELESVDTWVAMVQKEVGERFAAAPSTSAYGVPSVLAQLACDVRVARKIPRTVFHPVPNVDSVLVGLRRHGPAPPASLRDARPARLRAPPQGAGALARAGPGRGPRHPRPHARGARRARPSRRRPRRVARARRLARAVGAAVLAPGKVNLCLLVGAPRADGLHPLVSVVQPVDLADELTLERRRGADIVVCPGVEGENLAARALAEFRAATGWDGPPLRLDDRRSGSRSRPGWPAARADAAAALRLDLARSSGLPIPNDLADAARRRRHGDARTARRALMTGAGEHVEPLPGEKPPLIVVPLDAAARAPARSTASSTRATRRARPRSSTAAAAAIRAGALEPVNDLEPAARRLCPRDRPGARSAARSRRPAPDGHRLRPDGVRRQRRPRGAGADPRGLPAGGGGVKCTWLAAAAVLAALADRPPPQAAALVPGARARRDRRSPS